MSAPRIFLRAKEMLSVADSTAMIRRNLDARSAPNSPTPQYRSAADSPESPSSAKPASASSTARLDWKKHPTENSILVPSTLTARVRSSCIPSTASPVPSLNTMNLSSPAGPAPAAKKASMGATATGQAATGTTLALRAAM